MPYEKMSLEQLRAEWRRSQNFSIIVELATRLAQAADKIEAVNYITLAKKILNR